MYAGHIQRCGLHTSFIFYLFFTRKDVKIKKYDIQDGKTII